MLTLIWFVLLEQDAAAYVAMPAIESLTFKPLVDRLHGGDMSIIISSCQQVALRAGSQLVYLC